MIRKHEGKKGTRWHVTVYAGKGKRVLSNVTQFPRPGAN